MVAGLHRLRPMHGRDGSSSRRDRAVQPRLHGFDAELRSAIDTLRVRQGLKRTHLTELRSAVAAVYAARGLSAPAWIDATVTPNLAPVRVVHIVELRAAVLALQ
jgi:hypothetical protein